MTRNGARTARTSGPPVGCDHTASPSVATRELAADPEGIAPPVMHHRSDLTIPTGVKPTPAAGGDAGRPGAAALVRSADDLHDAVR